MALERSVLPVQEYISRFLFSLEERLVDVGVHWDGAFPVTFRRAQFPSVIAPRMPHSYGPVLPIDRRPLEPLELSLPHSRTQGREHHLSDNPVCVGQE